MAKNIHAFRQDQSKKIKLLKVRGFEIMREQHNGILMALVDGDNFTQRILVTKHGRLQRYKPRKATNRDRQMLPRRNFVQLIHNGG